jgi:hypothetical protein
MFGCVQALAGGTAQAFPGQRDAACYANVCGWILFQCMNGPAVFPCSVHTWTYGTSVRLLLLLAA